MTSYGTATLDDIRRVGVEALVQALGPVGMIRFLQQFETGRGDYTAERQRWHEEQGPSTPQRIEALGDEILREQAAGGLGRPG